MGPVQARRSLSQGCRDHATGERIKHIALHSAKYTAYLVDSIGDVDHAKLIKTLTDVFIIVLLPRIR